MSRHECARKECQSQTGRGSLTDPYGMTKSCCDMGGGYERRARTSYLLSARANAGEFYCYLPEKVVATFSGWSVF
jgi:hypothetical protein